MSSKTFQIKSAVFFEQNNWITFVEISVAIFITIAVEFGCKDDPVYSFCLQTNYL